MTDPIIKAALDLKKELADVSSPDLDAVMQQIMDVLLAATVEPDKAN